MNHSKIKSITFILILILGWGWISAQVFDLEVKNNEIFYHSDSRGNRIIDFSTCGYNQSETDIPDVSRVIFVPYKAGDASGRIQRAIDYVSSLPLNKNGFRGAVLLDIGIFELEKCLTIATSGVVLQGKNKENTVLLKKGVERTACIRMEGHNDLMVMDTLNVTSSYIPVSAREMDISSGNKVKAGSRVIVVRPSTKEWIASLKCEIFGGGISALGWKPGDADICWDRTVTSVNGNRISLDAPLTVAVDVRYGGAKLLLYNWAGRIQHSAVENLTLVSDYNKQYPKDEDHCWTGISIENAENCWVRKVTFKQFAGSAVIVQPSASKVTVEDCISLSPVSEIGGMRRNTFYTMGQQTLFQRCYSEHGIHDFAVGYCAAGPNAFVQCESKESFGFSGSISSWACGLLFDIVNIDGHNLTFKNLGQSGNGAGWNTANSLFWQCTAAEIECYTPAADAVNRAYGCWAQFSGDGQWSQSNNQVQPRSFFYSQLQERLGKNFSERARILPLNTNASSSPTVEVAMKLAEEAKKPRLTLLSWINSAIGTIEIGAGKLKSIDDIKHLSSSVPSKTNASFEITDGHLLMNHMLLVGDRVQVPWWNGSLRTRSLSNAGLHITRFVPDREGTGLTDRIDTVVSRMKQNNCLVLDHNYGLWYDRRRDDHERIHRRDGDAWAPFYEQPFSRANCDEYAWDGMSKYDLNRPNAWYWSRLKEFADKGAEQGLLLFHQNYFQHNILEAGAHWVDSPWRTANNINATGFPEPVNFAGDKRIFEADFFYDVTHPVRRELHRNYIRQCLHAFAGNANVIQLISEEYTGPLHFVQFWLDVIAEWEAETGNRAIIALSATKDVQDAILSDLKRAEVVDIIDIRYWHYKNDGTLYAPEGGKNLAPRQHARLMKVGKVTFKEAYKAVGEYRKKYPQKAVTYYAQNYPDMGWAVLMAGGSCPVVPVKNKAFLADAALMKVEETGTEEYCKLVKSDKGCIIYSHSEIDIPVNLLTGNYVLNYINPRSGEVVELFNSLNIKEVYSLKIQKGKEGIYWFYRK